MFTSAYINIFACMNYHECSVHAGHRVDCQQIGLTAQNYRFCRTTKKEAMPKVHFQIILPNAIKKV